MFMFKLLMSTTAFDDDLNAFFQILSDNSRKLKTTPQNDKFFCFSAGQGIIRVSGSLTGGIAVSVCAVTGALFTRVISQ